MKVLSKRLTWVVLLCSVSLFAPVSGQFPVITQTVTITPQLDVFRTPEQQYTLSAAPSTPDVLVFVNGLLMLRGEDYIIEGTVLTFTRQQIGEDPVIQVFYWVFLSRQK
jgi:hypothetical protein